MAHYDVIVPETLTRLVAPLTNVDKRLHSLATLRSVNLATYNFNFIPKKRTQTETARSLYLIFSHQILNDDQSLLR